MAADGGRGDRPPTLKACPLTLAAAGAKAPDEKKGFFYLENLGAKDFKAPGRTHGLRSILASE